MGSNVELFLRGKNINYSIEIAIFYSFFPKNIIFLYFFLLSITYYYFSLLLFDLFNSPIKNMAPAPAFTMFK